MNTQPRSINATQRGAVELQPQDHDKKKQNAQQPPQQSHQLDRAPLPDQEGDQQPHPRPSSPSTKSNGTSRSSSHGLSKLWSRQIAIIVSHEGCRDHFANERTFLAYLRTSATVAVLGVLIAQLFRLERRDAPEVAFGAFALGIPLASACTASAMVIVLIGAFRFWRQQNAMAREKYHVGGWETISVGLITLAIIITTFVLVMIVGSIRNEGLQ